MTDMEFYSYLGGPPLFALAGYCDKLFLETSQETVQMSSLCPPYMSA